MVNNNIGVNNRVATDQTIVVGHNTYQATATGDWHIIIWNLPNIMVLQSVVVIPDLPENLISLNRLLQDGYSFSRTNTEITINTLWRHSITIQKSDDDNYYVDTETLVTHQNERLSIVNEVGPGARNEQAFMTTDQYEANHVS